jgi:hypothetical protein
MLACVEFKNESVKMSADDRKSRFVWEEDDVVIVEEGTGETINLDDHLASYMAYERPRNSSPLSKDEKLDLLKQYFEYYRSLAATDRSVLNQKLPREALNDLLNSLGAMLLAKSKHLASIEGPVGNFLDNNPLPEAIEQRLPREFRVFCLALNAIKQWVSAEQSATDRYLLGGDARKLWREVADSDSCFVTGEIVGPDCELHHPVRDGRPAIPLSKHGHDLIEGQLSSVGDDDPIEQALSGLRRKGNRSWAQLRRGCLDCLGRPEPRPSKRGPADDRAFATKAAAAANIDYEEILEWLKRKGL